MPVPTRPVRHLPRFPARVLRALLPLAEREEVLADLQAEYARRVAVDGRFAARWWAWRQALGSVPALLGRSWWRGMTGFEPQANRMRPGGPMFESVIMDVRYAARRLLSRPVYAALAILTLGLGAGGTAAIYSVVRALLLDPLPIAREEQVGVLWFAGSWTEEEFLRLRHDFPGFQRMAAYRPGDVTLEGTGGPIRLVPGVAVSAELFHVLGTPPLLGRTFRGGEDATGAEPVAVLSHSLWQELGGDPAIVGKPLLLGGIARTVVGVMPRGFWFPSPTTHVWTTAAMDPQNRSGRYTLVGRVAEGQSVANLEGPLQALTRMLAANFNYPNPQWDKTRNPSIESAREFLVGDVRPSLIATLAAMAAILLIACANVAALMLGQLDAQATDIAVRAALGANRQRLIQQLAVESLLLGALSGTAGAVLAVAAFEVLLQALPLGALAETALLDWTVFRAAMASALGAAVLVALVPGAALWRGSSLQSTLATMRTSGVGTRGGRLEGGLVVAQMALAVLLAAGAGLLIRSVANLRAIDPGVQVDGVAVIDATMPVRLNPDERRRAIVSVLPALQALPGLRAAAAAQKLPLRGSGDNWGLGIEGRPELNATTAFRMVTADYFATLGIPLRRGRTFDVSDREGSGRVVVINEALAAKFFPDEDPVGKVLRTFGPPGERIVGIVGNAAEARLIDPPVPARYMLYEHVPAVWNNVSFVLRADSDDRLAALVEAARSTLARDGRQLAVQETTTMRHVFDRAMGPTAQVVTLVSLLAALALVLGAVGVYGVISHYVLRRSREYGIRLALGQPPAGVVREVVGRGAALVVVGSVIGVVAALVVSRLLASLLYGVRPTDPTAMGAAVAILLVVGMLAAFVPARRASLTDPAVVLRQP
ncbi:MAG TPA: ADOP family duplicated permease [Vicinamibacterales bacterium]|nr:ADOP family duplicated permease [Vicinamibacterales bacterium]